MTEIIKTSNELETLRSSLIKDMDPKKSKLTICTGTGCLALGAEKVVDTFKEEIEKENLTDKVDITTTGCHGFCERGPLALVHPNDIFYQKIGKKDVIEIMSETILKNEVIDRLLYQHPITGENIVDRKDVPFYKHQRRIVLQNNEIIDPTNILDYIAHGGYAALSKVLNEMTPEEVIKEIKNSNLRGRGGAGFPAGKKWESCRNVPREPKYVICNADEGDPGAFMDRSIIEGNPHSVIEGMIIGAYAIGSHNGYIYVRNEYPLAVRHFTLAVKEAKKYGLLGKNILKSGFGFDIKINRGGGAFVCGESTALMASLEGKVGEPRDKIVHSTESGVWNKPSNLNNVETWASVPYIIENGAEWYSKIGTEKSKGTKVFSLVGKVNNTGLVEVPMGISLREIIYDIGGGIPNNKKFKAVQTGGPSGGCIPAELIDMPVDFEKLTEVGSMMGSGGMIVMDEDTCVVDVAKYFIEFLKEESCGKCVPCREGIKRMYEILMDICEGKGSLEDLDLLEELSDMLKDASLCLLGGTAPNPVLTTLKYFKDEYLAHIVDKKCPAHVCTALIKYTINEKLCDGCMKCAVVCPEDAVEGEKDKIHVILQDKCSKCGICYESCKTEAIKVE
jgi:NADH:ubiquinone oxidoreductase subunit F (NADH-binding)/(2Fe-2S) ferredoxin/NAD-dependent dihydropyrimidine dehydrogenase PreA subunit